MKAVMVLFAFLTAWVEKDFKKAFDHVSKTWAENRKPENLEETLPSIIPDGFDIGLVQSESPVKVLISVDLALEGKSQTVTFELVRESWPRIPDVHGDWGIVPGSIDFAGETKEKKPKTDKVKPATPKSPKAPKEPKASKNAGKKKG